ncbi:MAG: hypothetical protein HZA17_10255 [Nitrospirae bacterium]|nr:hypothetical protein [Nitrospirota bacterium]
MMNNYFHDVATAMLMASGVTMWVILVRAEKAGSPDALDFMFRLYQGISKVVIGSLIWITVSAIPRILTFSSFEWANAFSRNHVPGLLAKHVVAFIILLCGMLLWIRLIKRIGRLKDIHDL